MQRLFSDWHEVIQRLKSAKRILLLSDYDGTLTPIVERPELANLSEEMRQLLQSLAHQRRFTVGIISGRALMDIKSKVDVRGIIYAGNHGLEIEGPGLSFVNPLAEELTPILRLLHAVLTKSLGSIRGVLVENKGLTLSVHYRMVEDDKAEEVKSVFERIMATAHSLGRIRITSGKKVYEVRPPVAWDKGKAIKLLMKRFGKGGRASRLLPIYMGDDLTDEDGFRIIERYGGGISVFVGEKGHESAAHYYLESPAEVEEFLSMLLEGSQRGWK